MLNALLSHFKSRPSAEETECRRSFPRRRHDACICIINGHPYAVENWSMGGVLIRGNARMLKENEDIDITLKFRVHKGVLCIDQPARVLRRSRHKTALIFPVISEENRHQFMHILERL